MAKHNVPHEVQNSNLIDLATHEFHNLISVVIAEAQLLQLSFPKSDSNYSSAAAIERAGRQLEALVDRLTDSVRRGSSDPQHLGDLAIHPEQKQSETQ